MVKRHDWPQLLIRIPPDLKAWLEQFSTETYSSQSIEIIRALEDRRSKVEASKTRRKITSSAVRTTGRTA